MSSFHSLKVGRRVKEWREHRKMSQYQLADRIGYSRSGIANMENGFRPWNNTVIGKIAKALRTHPSNLLT